MTSQDKRLIQELHRKTSSPLLVITLYTTIFIGLGVIAILYTYWWICVPAWIMQAYIGHALLLGFHETSHYVLHPNRKINELHGIITGTVILTPITAYRWVHNQHHTHLGTKRDTELWPYVDCTIPRWKRISAAIGELFFGFIYTPIIFFRGVSVELSLPKPVMFRLRIEYILILVYWSISIFLITWFGFWFEFIVGYLVGTWGAGNLQSWRKLTEHLGLFGNDVPSNTRTVIDLSALGKLVSASLFHIDLHGPHHKYGKIPCHNLPVATTLVYDGEPNVYRHYPAAIWDMVKSLVNPRVGYQWIKQDPASVPKH